jgi:hypothetical protein
MAAVVGPRPHVAHVIPRRAADSIAPEGSPVERLNGALQRMFRERGGFGMSRLVHNFDRRAEFSPSTPEEAAAVKELKADGWAVGFYLCGRENLDAPMTPADWKRLKDLDRARLNARQGMLHGPVAVTRNVGEGYPGVSEVWEDGRKALESFTTTEVFRSTSGRWSVEARPVRADQDACLKCHEVEKGDAIGSLLYVYASGGTR